MERNEKKALNKRIKKLEDNYAILVRLVEQLQARQDQLSLQTEAILAAVNKLFEEAIAYVEERNKKQQAPYT